VRTHQKLPKLSDRQSVTVNTDNAKAAKASQSGGAQKSNINIIIHWRMYCNKGNAAKTVGYFFLIAEHTLMLSQLQMQSTTLSFDSTLTMDIVILDLLSQARDAYTKSPATRGTEIPSFAV